MEITGREEPRFPSVESNERRDAALIAALRGNSWPSCRSTRSASFPSVSWSALASGSGSPNIGAGTRTIAPDCDNRRRNRGAGAGPAHGSSRKRIQQLAAKEIIPRTAKRKFPLLGGIAGYVRRLKDAQRQASRSATSAELQAARVEDIRVRVERLLRPAKLQSQRQVARESRRIRQATTFQAGVTRG